MYFRFPFLVSVNTTASPWPLCHLFFRLSYSGNNMPTKAEMKVVLTLYKSIQYQRAGNSRDSVKTSWSTFHNVQNEVEEREKKRTQQLKKKKKKKKKKTTGKATGLHSPARLSGRMRCLLMDKPWLLPRTLDQFYGGLRKLCHVVSTLKSETERLQTRTRT